MTSIARTLLGFAAVSTTILGGSFQYVGAQSAGEAATTSEPNLQEPSSEPASEEPALQLKLDDTGVDVVPSPPRTADGYTLEEMELRVKRAKIGFGVSVGALLVGSVMGLTALGKVIPIVCVFECPVPPEWVAPVGYTSLVLAFGGIGGMIASGILLGRRRRDRDRLKEQLYGRPRRVQWDLETSRVVF
jgi:hypothetical protein